VVNIVKAVADLGAVRGVQMHPPLVASNVFFVHNCTSPSNDLCSSGMQQQQPGTALTYQFLTDLQTSD